MSVCDHFHRDSVRYVMVSQIVTAYTGSMISWLIVISTSALFWYCALMAI